jgi:hypothetical protein
MDNAARARQRILAVFLPVTAVLYISCEALDPKGTDQVVTTMATAFNVLAIAAAHPTQLYVAGVPACGCRIRLLIVQPGRRRRASRAVLTSSSRS